MKNRKIKTHWIIPLLLVTMLFVALPGSLPAKMIGDKAMWVWHSSDEIFTEDGREALIAFSKEKNVNIVYLNTGRYLENNSASYRAFIKLAHLNNISVYALDGSAKWAKQINHMSPTERMHEVFMYNENAQQDERFDGMQFDIEPYLLSEWKTEERDQLIQEYLIGLENLANMADTYGSGDAFEFMAAIPFWFDKEKYETMYRGVSKPLSDHVMDTVGNVVIMAYRDTAAGRDSISYHSDHEIKYASEHNLKVVIGVETQHIEPYEKVSFFEEGEAYMEEQLQSIDQLYSTESGYGGQAIHDYQNYKALKQ